MNASPLAGVRVVDLAGPSLALGGKILADLGADVVLVEPPGGSPARRVPPLLGNGPEGPLSPHFLYTAAGKSSVTADLSSRGGHELAVKLIERADVVLLTDDDEELQDRGLSIPTLRRRNARLVVTSLTPFGRRGSKRRWKGSDLVAWASSGALQGIGDPDRGPLAPGGRLAFAAGSLNAVAGTVLALRARDRTARGQVVDVSLQEAVLSVTGESGPFFPLEGGTNVRVGRLRAAAQGLFTTADGLIELLPFMPSQWDSLAEWIHAEVGIQEATMDAFRGPVTTRAPFADLINGWVAQLTKRYTKQAFLFEAQRRGIPCGAVNEPRDLLDDPHLQAVDGWVHQDPGPMGEIAWPRPPLRFGGSLMTSGPVPSPGTDNERIYVGELGITTALLRTLRVEGSV